MKDSFQDGSPIFQQIEKKISDSIVKEYLSAHEQVPSTNQFAKQYQINPATAAKGINLLVEKGILYKKRGVGMFVSENAKKQLIDERKRLFYNNYIVPLLTEADQLQMTREEIIKLMDEGVN